MLMITVMPNTLSTKDVKTLAGSPLNIDAPPASTRPTVRVGGNERRAEDRGHTRARANTHIYIHTQAHPGWCCGQKGESTSFWLAQAPHEDGAALRTRACAILFKVQNTRGLGRTL